MDKKKRQHIGLILIFLVGLLIMTYPFYINAINTFWDAKTIREYQQLELERLEAQRAENELRNRELVQGGFFAGNDAFDGSMDEDVVDLNEHFLGTITIPKLKVKLPIYDTTNNILLEKGVTVLNGTSLPLGGLGTHSVMTAHRGLPNRELFTNLPKLDNGDVFTIEVMGETLAYEVFDSIVVEPFETESLKLEKDQDLVTLVTCTPYMINSHRLLVSAKRVPYTVEISEMVIESDQVNMRDQSLILSGVVSLVLGLIVLLIIVLKRKKRD